ncbi:MAG: LPS export ABC transporter permease LptG [Kangiellaceae bacterium]|nr:LPS export ABC transporter permease LptG [Kangiellaceae bacterium]MCW9000730.1 LPS export ABC transporter permease LptG [Kangiellaceae bacterium]MCW9017117.1 LPS export ABC transporter permease LptG [Kangiellaceae bacterium]
MFNLLDRYITKQLVISSLFILMVITGLQVLLGFLNELGDTGEGSYGVGDAVLFTALMIPARVLEVFPMSVLVGSLSALGTMASNSELTVMRAAGVTTWRIAGSAIKGSLILMVLVVIVSEWVAPASTKAAQQLRAAAVSGGEVSLANNGMWAKGEGKVVHIESLYNDSQLGNITIYQIDDNQLTSVLKAERAEQKNDVWELLGVTTVQFRDNKLETNYADKRLWTNPIKQEQLDTLTLEPEMLNIVGIYRYLDYLAENKMETEIFMLAFWRKLMQPLAIAVMIFLATSFVFGPMRDVTMGARILSGVMLGFGFHLANQSFGPISLVYNFPPIFGATIPLLLFSYLAYYLMKKSS